MKRIPVHASPLALALLLAGVARSAAQPAPAAPPVLTREDAVALALRQNPTLEAARRERNAELIEADRARPAFRPEVNATATQIVRAPRVELPGFKDAVVLPNSISRLEIGLRQPLFQFGVGNAPKRRADALAAAARSGYRREELETILQVREAYLAVVRAQALSGVAERGADLARANVELTRLLKEGGLQADVDILEAQRAEAEAQGGLLQAQNGVALARANVNRLLGREIDAPFRIDAPGPLPEPPAALDALTARALGQRPEIALLRQNIEAAEAGIRLAKASRLPRVSLEAGYALQTETALVPRSGIFGGLTLTAPLFDGSVRNYTVREAEQRVGQLRSTLEAAEQGIALEIERQRLAMGEARARIETARRAVEAAEKVHEITRLKLERGMATQLEVQSARLRLEEALSLVAEAENDLRLAQVRLERALGEGPTLEVAPEEREPDVPALQSDPPAAQDTGVRSEPKKAAREREPRKKSRKDGEAGR